MIRRIRDVFLVGIFFLTLAPVVFAAESVATLMVKIDQSIKNQFSGWQIDRKEGNSDSRTYAMHLGKESVTIYFKVLKSMSKAYEEIHRAQARVAMSPVNYFEEASMRGEGLLYGPEPQTGATMVLACKSNVFFQINGSLFKTTDQFLQTILKLIQ